MHEYYRAIHGRLTRKFRGHRFETFQCAISAELHVELLRIRANGVFAAKGLVLDWFMSGKLSLMELLSGEFVLLRSCAAA